MIELMYQMAVNQRNSALDTICQLAAQLELANRRVKELEDKYESKPPEESHE